VERARVVLEALEEGERQGGGSKQKALIDDLPLFAAIPPAPPPAAKPAPSPALDMLEKIHPDELTPREALQLLYDLKEKARQ
jgi:DNA mismatch repair protein MutS